VPTGGIKPAVQISGAAGPASQLVVATVVLQRLALLLLIDVGPWRLAGFGQTYQTSADPWQLFAAWAAWHTVSWPRGNLPGVSGCCRDGNCLVVTGDQLLDPVAMFQLVIGKAA
jgi:hypothetical protein